MSSGAKIHQVVKADPSGKIVYIGPDLPKRWRRQKADADGNFEIREDSYVYTDARGNRRRGGRPMGCVFPARRPGRYILPEDLPGKVW